MPARRKFLFSFLVAWAIFWFFPKIALAQITINEFFSGTTSDWVEIYNTGTISAQLSGFRIGDSDDNKKDLSGELGVGGFQAVGFSNRLNNDGDIVRLIKVTGEEEKILEEIPYGTEGGLCAPDANGSIGRLSDGGPTIVRLVSNTKGASNNGVQENPCPTPTPTLEPIVTSEPEPTNVPTPTPTPTSQPPTPTPTPKLAMATPTPTKKPAVKIATDSGEVLGEGESSPSAFYPWENKQATVSQESTPSGRGRWRIGGLLAVGFILLFGAGFGVWYTQLRFLGEKNN